jgi:hypothetical protein
MAESMTGALTTSAWRSYHRASCSRNVSGSVAGS